MKQCVIGYVLGFRQNSILFTATKSEPYGLLPGLAFIFFLTKKNNQTIATTSNNSTATPSFSHYCSSF